MPICEECKKEVTRRQTWRERKVCPACAEKLQGDEYSAWCDIIMSKRKSS